ncbi:MAG: 2-isopropylmalate synthase [Desulfovibrionaceae bacterium]|nr:2-isopropylmalate synthase [Desulfovibrionaceae bacterium]MBF0514002.1 2-isopropylmalate synthase [Desulfovibrionaceae bacterium]
MKAPYPDKYRPFPPVALENRAWPNRSIDKAPVWLSTDLRDGNQALFEPLDPERKLRLFQLLLDIGFKEIEVAFPAASRAEFDFTRALIEGGRVPADVTLSVLTQSREHIIRRTMESLAGARRAIVHLYVSTAPVFRRVVFGLSRSEVAAMAVRGARLIREIARDMPDTDFRFEFTPENFSGTELPFARDVCQAVMEEWGASESNKVIINLPSTVELSTPNVYADQIEWMAANLAHRDAAIISVHTHNDRGCAVAAAELAMLAGAQRVEGCLFGNGERTGNADIVTLALNLYTQGVDPGLDFSAVNRVAREAEELTSLPVHPRHPYCGDLVFTAFSGSHQDAIKKGLAAQAPGAPWRTPYLPLDPADLGRTYDSIIRVNSQSGKGGVAYLMETAHGLILPRRLQIEFSGMVQQAADASGGEIDAARLWTLFSENYLEAAQPLEYRGHRLFERGDAQGIALTLRVSGRTVVLEGLGNGPIAAVVTALNLPLTLHAYEERAMGQGAQAEASAFVEVSLAAGAAAAFGVGVHENIATASIRAVVSAANRALAKAAPEDGRRLLAAALQRAQAVAV